jgi:glycerophosphoryl diester phosphodiesterase
VLWVVLALHTLSGGAMAASANLDEVRFLAVQGHRGASALAPENTLAAFRKAIELGADGMEMDLQLTRDGAVVVIHDDTLDRTTDGRGRVTDLSLAEIKRADAGVKFGSAYHGERVPTLTEVIDLVKTSGNDRVRLNLEIKFGEGREGTPADLEERILAVLRATGFVERVTVQSFHHPSPSKMKRLEPRIPTGLLVGARRSVSDPVSLVRQYRADYYAPEHGQVTPELVQALHLAGIPVVTWTVNEEPLMRRLIEAGLGSVQGDAIISDHPDRAVNLRKALQAP